MTHLTKQEAVANALVNTLLIGINEGDVDAFIVNLATQGYSIVKTVDSDPQSGKLIQFPVPDADDRTAIAA